MHRLRILAASTIVAVAGVVGVHAPAHAAGCAAGAGVTVVVDGQGAYGGTSTTCLPGGGRNAAEAFPRAGAALTYARLEPGFVCKVRGLPADTGCGRASGANAYWSLWWSTGNGTWTYSTTAVGSLDVPKGGWVAFSWNSGGGRDQPRVTPRNAGGSAGGSPSAPGGGSSGGGSASRGTSGAPSPSSPAEKRAAQKQKAEKERKKQLEKAKRKADEKAGRTPSASASTSDAQESDEAVRNAAQEGSGPGSGAWIAILAVLALGGTAGFTAWRRHRTP